MPALPAVRREAVAAGIVAIFLPTMVAAQSGAARGLEAPQGLHCRPIPVVGGATVKFGRAGGNILPRSLEVYANGGITVAAGDSMRDSVATIPADAVAALARLARTGGFWALRAPAVRRPIRNPDFAREYIEVTLTCGRKRAEYVAGAEPAVFSEYRALPAAVARAP